MKFANNPAQHLSNYEVLQHFIALKKDNDALRRDFDDYQYRFEAKARRQVKMKREEDEGWEVEQIGPDVERRLDEAFRRGISDELVWVQDELLKYLCGADQATSRQTEEGIVYLADALQDSDLAKAEVLQIVNLAPTHSVELHAIIESPEVRFQPDAVGYIDSLCRDTIKPTLLDAVPDELAWYAAGMPEGAAGGEYDAGQPGFEVDDEEMMNQQEEEQYVHEAEWGAGKEAAIDDAADEAMD
ncbi:hypothetical protein Q5752_002796 [Cryptotrichosporon argae]